MTKQADERLLEDLLRERGVGRSRPCDRQDRGGVTEDERLERGFFPRSRTVDEGLFVHP